MRLIGMAGSLVRRPLPLSLLLLASVAAAGPTDPAADFLVDITHLADEPCAIRVSTDRMYWQLPAEQIRKGYGIGLFSVLRNTTNNCEARIYVEVEEFGSKDIEVAADEAAASLPALLEQRQTRVKGEVKRDKKADYSIGGAKVQGCKLSYSVEVLNADPVTVDPATALMFLYKKALVTVTVENYASSTVDHFTRFLKTLSIEKGPPKPADCRLKMVDATGGAYQYMAMPLLPGMLPERSDELEGNAVGFCRYQDGKPAVRLRIAKSETDRPMEPKEDAEFRHSDLLDQYEGVTPLEEVEFAGKKCWLCTGTGESGTRLAVLYFRPRKLMWTWTLESIGADDKRFQADLAAFKASLKKLECWTADSK